jgi:hypothetical protein
MKNPNSITILHSNSSVQVVHKFPCEILNELLYAQKLGAAGISVHCKEPFISGCITSEREARDLIKKFN